MANQDGSGEIRRADPEAAAQDPTNAQRQQQVQADHDAIQAQARRVDATTPPNVRDRTVDEIVADAEQRADRER